MALVFMDGFDNYGTSTDMLTAGYTNMTISGFAAGQVSPGKAVLLSNAGSISLDRVLNPLGANSPTVTTVTLGFAMAAKQVGIVVPDVKVNFSPNTFLGTSGNNWPLTFDFMTDGSLKAMGTGSYVYATSLGKPNSDNTSGNWHYVEISATCGAAGSGSFTVKLDGTNVLAAKGLSLNILGFAGFSFTLGGGSVSIDDLYVCDDQGSNPLYNTFLGICQISTLFPKADGTYHQFSPIPSGNARWTNVSETVPNGDATYNTASGVGMKDTFTGGAAFSSNQAILAVQPMVLARQDDTATRAMQTYVKSGSREQGGAPLTLSSTSYKYASDIYTADPNTGTAWTAGGVNALEFGYNIVQ